MRPDHLPLIIESQIGDAGDAGDEIDDGTLNEAADRAGAGPAVAGVFEPCDVASVVDGRLGMVHGPGSDLAAQVGVDVDTGAGPSRIIGIITVPDDLATVVYLR